MAAPEIQPNTCWRKTLFGTTATYLVRRVEDDIVIAEVQDAPGLPAGVEVRLTKGAFESMEQIDHF